MMTETYRRSLSGRALLEHIRSWCSRRDGLNEIEGCDPAELGRILQDLKVTEPELTANIKAGSSEDLLVTRMIDALGLDYDRLERHHPQVAWDLQRVCAACGNKKRCRSELAASSAAANFHQFCNNAYTLEALAVDHTVASSAGEASSVTETTPAGDVGRAERPARSAEGRLPADRANAAKR